MTAENTRFEVRSAGYESKAPDSWELAKFDELSDVTDYVANGSFASLKDNVKYQKNDGYAILVRLTDHTNNWLGNYVYVDKKAYEYLSKSSLKPGDIVIANVGDPGQVFRVPSMEKPMTLGPNSVLLKPSSGIDKGYFAAFFSSAWGQDLIRQITTGTAQKKFNKTGLRSTVVPLAPLAEQRRIVSKIEELFSDLDAGEDNLRAAQKQIARYRQSVLKAAVTGELVNAPDSSWQQFTVGELLTDIRYGTAKKCSYDPSKTPVLRIPNVVSGKIDLSELKHTDFEASELNKLKLQEGDVLLVRSNGSADLVAKSAVVGAEAKGYAYAGYLIRLRLQQDKVLPYFLHLFLHSPATRSYIERQARSTSGVHNINSDEIKSLVLQLPSIEIQAEIIDRVEELFSRIDALETWCRTELARSARLRQSILKSAFSGQLVPQDPNDEPASALLERIRAEREAQPARKNGRAPSAEKTPAKRGRKPRTAAPLPDAKAEQLKLL